jgi:hypothetical protein
MHGAASHPSRAWHDPTWPRLALAGLVALLGFLLPQAVPLEWYPLNQPGTDINYLEISCAASIAGTVEIRYDLARNGHRPIDTISWPISPTAQTYTYTFPLPDAPIVELRVLPPAGGELTIRQMRIINRRNEEIRRFTADLFRIERDVTAVVPLSEGWKLVAAPGGSAPSARIELFSPIIPVGQDHRNLLRCFLSAGYLSLMLWILLLAVLFVFYRPKTWRDLLGHLGFMAAIAILFAIVGNRGLIRNSIAYARYSPPAIPPGLKLEFDLVSGDPSQAQLFWDTGNGFNEAESVRQNHEPHQGQQTLRFLLPEKMPQRFRFDPRDNEGWLKIRGIRLVDAGQRTQAVLPLNSLLPERDIATLEAEPDGTTLKTAAGASDPITDFTPEALEIIRRALAGPKSP